MSAGPQTLLSRPVSLLGRLYQFLFGSMGQKIAWILLALVLFVQYLNTPLIEGVRNRSFDIYQRLSPRIESKNPPVVVIDIDEKSMKAVGQWPWSRDIIAAMINRITKAGAVAIGFDVVFAEADRLSPPLLAKTMRGIDPDTREKLSVLPSNDDIMAQAMKRSRVILGGFVTNDDEVVKTDSLGLLPSINWIGKNPNKYVKPAAFYVGNIEALEKAAAGFSNFTLDSDFDGIIRRVPLFSRVDDKLIPILGLEILRVATGQNALVKANENGIEGVVVARSLIPTDGFGRMWVRYSKYSSKNYVSAVDILSGDMNPAQFAGKLVLLGTSATGLKDLRSTPVNSVVPGVEIHAQMIQTILQGDFLYRGDLMRAVEWLTILLCGSLLIAYMPTVGARATFLVLLLMLGTSMTVAAYLFLEKSILMDVTFFVATITLLYIVLVYSSFRFAEQQRSQIRSAFGHYLSPDLVNKLTDSPSQLRLGGEVKTMTFLFCDIRGFTAISEQFNTDPEGLTKFINGFLTPMTDIILNHGGTIDKYMGDCIMAFWNAPLDDPDHAKNAVETAIEMQVGLGKVNEQARLDAERDGRVFYPIIVGIGLNTGTCVVGNMGSEQRFDYSVLGDSVNLASRLEGQCKAYGMNVIVGPDTAKEIHGYNLLELDLIAVKGKKEAVQIFGCLDETQLSDIGKFRQLAELNRKMLEAYRSRNWDGAKAFAKQCLDLAPKLDVLYEMYLDRIETYQLNDPGEGWSGIFTAQTK